MGEELVIIEFVDTGFSGNKVSMISRTVFVVFLNGAPIYLFSKKNSACETSYFGSEFISTKQCCEYLKGLRHKLRMVAIPVNNPYFINGDNQSLLWNT